MVFAPPSRLTPLTNHLKLHLDSGNDGNLKFFTLYSCSCHDLFFVVHLYNAVPNIMAGRGLEVT